jgi:outer membrane protein assembly factor BamB
MRHTLLVLLVLSFAATTAPAAPRNWSFWRGPEQNGVSRERDLPEKFSLAKGKEENVVFAAPVGSITTPIVQDNQVYIINKVGQGITQQERVMALDADTGKVVWEHNFNAWHTDVVEDRLGFTHLVGDPETGNVYAHATSGEFIAFDKKGKVVWKHSLTEEFGRVSGYGGRITSAIVDEDKVIIGMLNGSWGEQTVGQTRLVAFQKKTGKIIWWGSGNYRVKDTYYSNPAVAVIKGQRLVLTGGGDGCIHAFKVRTGEKVWSYMLEDNGGAVNVSPVVKGDLVYIGHGEENAGDGTQGRVVCLDASQVADGAPKLVWKVDGIKAKFAAPILDAENDLLYITDAAANLFCLDAKTGKEQWKFGYGRNTKGDPVLADGKIYVTEVDGKIHILKPSKSECTRLFAYTFRSRGAPVELHGAPAVVNGRVYFTTTTQLICIGKKDHKAEPDKTPASPKEPAADPKAKVAHVEVHPADITLKPGQKVDFYAYSYDANGRLLGKVEATWAKAGMLPPAFPLGLTAPKAAPGATAPPPLAGTLSGESGTSTAFTVAKMPPAQFGRITATFEGVTGYARVRVAPNLPYSADFAKVPLGRTPAGWVNTMAKFAIVKGPDGRMLLRKRNDNASPLVARANAYIGAPSDSDYTVEADVMGTKVRDKDMPDIGVGACRYTLFLIGNNQEARLITWDAQKRIEKKIDYSFKPGVWYRMKITATVKGGKGIIKGKVWPRDEKEPDAWTLEAEDPIPNTEGAPLIYGFANGTIDAATPGAEIYYDNVKVTPNAKK